MKLFYRKYGDGPPLIIVHGLYGASDNWVTIGKALAENFEVYLIDQRNHGRSPHSPDHNYALMKEDLQEFMNDHSIERAVLMGHSMGGKTVMYFALDYPERVSSLIVIDIAPKSYNNKGDHIQTINHKKIVSALQAVDFTQISSRKEVEIALSQNINSLKVIQFLLKNLHRNKDNTFKWSLNVNALKKDMTVLLEGLEDSMMIDDKEITGFPILFVKGTLSDYILEEDVPKIRSIFPYADFQEIENAGHWVHAEEPEKLIKVIKNFVLE